MTKFEDKATNATGQLAWLNAILASIWPHAGTAIRDKVELEIMPELRKKPMCQKLRFVKFELGKHYPGSL